MTRANLVPPTRDRVGANPSATGESKALGKAPAVNPDHGESTRTRKTEYRTEQVQSRCCHRSCVTRSHAIGASRRDDLTPRTEVHRDRTALRGSPRFTASASGPRSTGVYRSVQGVPRLRTTASGRDTRPPPPKRRPTDDTPVYAGLSTRGSSRRRRFPPRSPKAPRHPPPALVAAAAHQTFQRVPAAHRNASRCVTTDPHPRAARTRCRHQVHVAWFKRTSGCPPCRHGRRHTTHTAQHRRGAPRRGTFELRPKPQPSHVAP